VIGGPGVHLTIGLDYRLSVDPQNRSLRVLHVSKTHMIEDSRRQVVPANHHVTHLVGGKSWAEDKQAGAGFLFRETFHMTAKTVY
jgi:hypothetical protein